ncbi:MAG TPA: DedA family protein [Candidatus Dormibacteraeota bacterium]|jgi:membrane protein DedA with SNARE-associated domain|nr:DedA family protein [Candidatus Dormibacteraeota bacterium]
MTHHILDLLRGALVHYGYWAVAALLLLESAGLPLPGETILVLASFLAFSEHELRLPWIIVVGTLASTAGGELGFALGRHGGRPLIERYRHVFRVRAESLERGERLFEKYGAATIFLARFLFGMRVLASLLAGALRMPWRKFFLFNFLGAAVWVTTICVSGYFFGGHWGRLARDLRRFDLAVLIAVVVAGLVWWWWSRRKSGQ